MYSQAAGCCDSHTVVYWARASICFVLCLTFPPFFNPRSRYADWQDGGGDQRAHQEHGPVEDHWEGAERCHQPRHQGAGEDDQQTGYAAEEERRVHEEDQRAGLTPSGGLWEVPDPHTKTGTHAIWTFTHAHTAGPRSCLRRPTCSPVTQTLLFLFLKPTTYGSTKCELSGAACILNCVCLCTKIASEFVINAPYSWSFH